MPQGEVFGLIKIKIPEAVKEERADAILIPKGAILEAARCLINHELDFDNLHCITAVDRKTDLELIYSFYSMKKRFDVKLKARLPLDDLTIESLTRFWKSADWLEREIYDLFGVRFLNHPNLRRILNPEDWTVHPLRKDFLHPDFVKKPQY